MDPEAQAAAGNPEGAPAATSATPNPAPTTPSDDGEPTISLAEAQKLRREAQALRQRLKEAESLKAEVDKLKQAQMSDEEKRAAELKALQERTSQADAERQTFAERERNLRLDNAILREIGRLRNDGEKPVNFADPDDVLALLNRADLLDEDGKPNDLERALRDFAKRKPHMTVQSAPAAFTASATNPPRSLASKGLPTWAEAQKFSVEQWAKYDNAQVAQIMQNR